jgi:hypothetical protein
MKMTAIILSTGKAIVTEDEDVLNTFVAQNIKKYPEVIEQYAEYIRNWDPDNDDGEEEPEIFEDWLFNSIRYWGFGIDEELWEYFEEK